MSEENTTQNEEVLEQVDNLAEPSQQIPSDASQNPLNGLVVQDGIIMLQLIDRLVQRGALAGREALPVGILRQKVVGALEQHGFKEQ